MSTDKKIVCWTCLGSVVLQAVLLWYLEVVISTLVLSDSDVPGPGDGAGGGVDVYVDGDTGGTGGHPHVLAGVIATDDWRGGGPRNSDCYTNTRFRKLNFNCNYPWEGFI